MQAILSSQNNPEKLDEVRKEIERLGGLKGKAMQVMCNVAYSSQLFSLSGNGEIFPGHAGVFLT